MNNTLTYPEPLTIAKAVPAGTSVTLDPEYVADKDYLQDAFNFRLPPKRKAFETFFYHDDNYDEPGEYSIDVAHTSVYYNKPGDVGDAYWRSWVPVMAVVEMREAIEAALVAALPKVYPTRRLFTWEREVKVYDEPEPPRRPRGIVRKADWVPRPERRFHMEIQQESAWLVPVEGLDRHGGARADEFAFVPMGIFWDNEPKKRWVLRWSEEMHHWAQDEDGAWHYSDTESLDTIG